MKAFQMTETIISKSCTSEEIPEDRNYSKYNFFTKLLFICKNNNSEKIEKWKNKISHFVDAQDRFDADDIVDEKAMLVFFRNIFVVD